ncbi:MAG: hypothetical protein ACO1OQ_07865 [Rufibacter sp.]
MTEEEFNTSYQESLDQVLAAMADCAEIDPQKFYSMACLIENLSIFSPFFYGMLKKQNE